jgi:hypothetical protein
MAGQPTTEHFRSAIRSRWPRRALLAGYACALLLSAGLPSVLKAADSAAQGEKQAAAAAQNACATFRVREQDQIWLVSTRHLGCWVGVIPTYQIWRYENGTWQPKTEAEFFAEDSAELLTPLYVHGNRIDASLAASYGLSVYFELVGKLDSEPPARFVIWSWPADQIRGPLNDIRTKAARCDYEAYYLGCFVAKMKPEVRCGIVGYSFGARIVSGAMHLAGGGSIFGRIVPPGPRPQFRVALWAAAEHNHWFLPGQFHSEALAAAEAWYVTINCCDPVLARYEHLDKCSHPAAVGYAGIYGRNLLPADVNARIEEVNVSNIVDGEHHWRPYLYSLYIQNRTRDYVMWHELSAGALTARAASTAAK